MAEVQVIPPKAARPDTLRVAAYCRVSSDSADQLHSYAAQIRAYTQAINAHDGWDLVDIYADEGLTGTRMDKREDFNRLMADCRKGKIDKIVVKSISRFARNTRDCLATLRELSSLGVTVKFEKENIDTGTLTSELMVSVSASLAQEESISISKNQRMSYQRRMERGEFITCSAPFGYKRCTWARNGVKRIVWRCVSRLEFGKKYCHNSPSMAEDKLHTAILTVLNRVVEASDGLQDELAETLRMVCTPEGDGNNLMELERNMEALTTRQNTLLDQVLAHMDDLTLTEQLKALLEEKQHLQTRIDAAKKEAANRINEDSRMAELAAYLEEHLSGFQQYDDGIVRQLVERITVVDAETIRIKFRYSDVEIEQAMC